MTNLGFAIDRPAVRMVISPAGLLFSVAERRDGLGDLNGDGKANDDVAKIYSFASQSLIDVDVATATSQLAIGDQWAAFSVHETHQGQGDLDGDGDARDRVIFAVELASGSVRNLGVQGDLPRIVGNSVVFRSIEHAAGKSDLNGDGDVSDKVLRVYDLDTDTLTSLDSVKRHRRKWFETSGSRVIFASKERQAGGNDLNGDGDTKDIVIQVYDTATQVLSNTGLQSKSYIVGANLVAVASQERLQGGIDQNNDGDTQRDIVLGVYDMASRTTRKLPIAINWKRMAVGDDFTLFGVRELTHFATQRNGDGDIFDDVLGCAAPIP